MNTPAFLPTPGGSFPHPFHRYVLERVLGRGGMGTVYLAQDPVLERRVALKVPHPHLLEAPAARQRFYREARAAARLRHPNLCSVLDLGEVDGRLYFTMDYIDGQPLAEEAIGDEQEIIRLIVSLATALAEAHRLQVIHRDLKPANVLLTRDGDPVVVDFGLALRLDVAEPLTEPGVGIGTLPYMAPEQRGDGRAAVGPECDIFSLGAILYRLLTGQPLPFGPERPSIAALRPGVSAQLEAICLRAVAWAPEGRFASMKELAAAVASCRRSPAGIAPARPLVPAESIRWLFLGVGERVAAQPRQDRLFLDVGNDLGPGVIDHHQLIGGAGSTVGLVLDHPAFLDAAIRPGRRASDPFVIVLHEWPDLDAVASAWLALRYLADGAFPPGAEALRRYVDAVDRGSAILSPQRPFTLHVAYLRLGSRLMDAKWNSGVEQWAERVRQGQALVAAVVERAAGDGAEIEAIDAFACCTALGLADREEIGRDRERYERKLVTPACHARQLRLRLPGAFGGIVELDGLLIRDVQAPNDPERCVYFKDWARGDTTRAPRGLQALCVFTAEGPGWPRRAIVSVAPDSGASLRGLGAALEAAEARRRQELYGVDDRQIEPATGRPRAPRPGYTSADPWYDGRGHDYTIVDSPRDGTLLSAAEIEAEVLRFGGAGPL